MRLAWFTWLASANAILFSAVSDRAYMAVAATPARARLGKPSGTAGDKPDKFELLDPERAETETTEEWDREVLRQLDELKPTLSYPFWQKDFDNAILHVVEMRRKQLLHDRKRPPPPPPLPDASTALPAGGRSSSSTGNGADVRLLEATKAGDLAAVQAAVADGASVRALIDACGLVGHSSLYFRVYGHPWLVAARIKRAIWSPLKEARIRAYHANGDENGDENDPTLSAALPAASPTKYAGYELSYTDAGTLQIYIPPKGVTVWGTAVTTVATVATVASSTVASRSIVRAVPLTVVGTAAAPLLLFRLLCGITSTASSGWLFKKTLIEPATDTTITIGKYEWTVVRRTVAGLVTLNKQGATDGLLQNMYACNADVEHFVPWASTGEQRRLSRELGRAGVPLTEVATQIVAHLQGYTAVPLDLELCWDYYYW